MRRGLPLLLALAALGGCSNGIPSFLGREGEQTGTFTFGDDTPEGAYEPVDVPLTSALIERGLHGVIVRVESIAPTQGYYAAQLAPVQADIRADETGILTLRLTALAPTTPQDVGAPATRRLTAAFFLQNVTLRDVKAVRVVAGGQSQTLPLPK